MGHAAMAMGGYAWAMNLHSEKLTADTESMWPCKVTCAALMCSGKQTGQTVKSKKSNSSKSTLETNHCNVLLCLAGGSGMLPHLQRVVK